MPWWSDLSNVTMLPHKEKRFYEVGKLIAWKKLITPFVLRFVVSSWFIGPALSLSSIEPSLLLAPPLVMYSLLHSACYLRTTCLPSASFLRHFSLTVAGLRAPLSRFLEGPLYKYPD